jgi:glutamine cyclotransferase
MPLSVGTVRDIPVRALKLCGLTWSGEFLWFSEAVSNQIMALDPATGEVERRIPCAGVRTDLTTLGGNLVQVAGENRVLRVIDPGSGRVVTEVPNPRPGNTLCGLEATRHGLWLGYEDLRRIDLRSAEDFRLIDTFSVHGGVAGVTVSDSYLAYADFRAGTINLVEIERKREVAAYSVAGNPTGITWDGTRIWYCDYTTLQLRAIEVPGITNG